jgi:hypothetical protein
VLDMDSRSITGDAAPTKCTSVLSSMNAITPGCGAASGCVENVHTCVSAAVAGLMVTRARADVTPKSFEPQLNCSAATISGTQEEERQQWHHPTFEGHGQPLHLHCT